MSFLELDVERLVVAIAVAVEADGFELVLEKREREVALLCRELDDDLALPIKGLRTAGRNRRRAFDLDGVLIAGARARLADTKCGGGPEWVFRSIVTARFGLS